MTKLAYDDDDYLAWSRKMQKLVDEYLETEGNTVDSLRYEVDDFVDEALENEDVEW